MNEFVDVSLFRNVVDVKKVDTPIAIVQKGDVRLVENQLIDDTNVVQEYSPNVKGYDVVPFGIIKVL